MRCRLGARRARSNLLHARLANLSGIIVVKFWFYRFSLTLWAIFRLFWLWLEGFNPQDHKQNKQKITHNVKLNP